MIFKNEHNAISDICEKSGYDGLEPILQVIDKPRVRLNANVNQIGSWNRCFDDEGELIYDESN